MTVTQGYISHPGLLDWNHWIGQDNREAGFGSKTVVHDLKNQLFRLSTVNKKGLAVPSSSQDENERFAGGVGALGGGGAWVELHASVATASCNQRPPMSS